MHRSRSAIARTLVFVLLLTADARLAGASSVRRTVRPHATLTSTLQAASGSTLRFKTNNGLAVDGAPALLRRVPHLVLFRNGLLTSPRERTLIVHVTGIEPRYGGVTVTLEIETQHGDPDHGSTSPGRIPIWSEARLVRETTGPGDSAISTVFTHTFGASITHDGRKVRTPTDYFSYRVTVASAADSEPSPHQRVAVDLAFLMESQWLEPLPQGPEPPYGAAPSELLVYCCDMIPFRKMPGSANEHASGLRRSEVTGFVRDELVPAMLDAFRTQTTTWGFEWHEAWTSYREGEDTERLTVALTDGETWYHGEAPVTGHSGISLNMASSDAFAPYDTLADALLSTFHHELFHNRQRSLNQHLGGDGQVNGMGSAWEFFSEGTAFLASTVGMPEVHLGRTGSDHGHATNANAQVDGDVRDSGSLVGLSGALYWRFLYEQCGGMEDRDDDPTAGMAVARNALAALYSGKIVDIAASTELIAALPAVMDRALTQTPSCRFRTFEESLVEFARAIYALHLEGGRCVAPGLPDGCGFYDPNGLYAEPAVTEIGYDGLKLQMGDELRQSFGTAFVDVKLYPGAARRPLTIEIEGAPGGSARFSVQVWKLVDEGAEGRPRPASEPAVLGTVGPGETLIYTVTAEELEAIDRIGLIITRVDADEAADPIGGYAIRLTAL